MKRKSTVAASGVVPLKLRKATSEPLRLGESPRAGTRTFGHLPLEVKYKILSYLEILDMCNFCRSCRHVRTMVECYASSNSCIQTRQFHHPHDQSTYQSGVMRQYRNIGILYKVIMFDCSFAMHLDFLSSTLKKHICFNIPDKEVQDGNDNIICNRQQTCQSMTYFGYFLREFIRNWNDNQIRRLFQTLIQHCFESNFWKKFTRLLFKFPGSDIKEELMVRLFLRRVFLNIDCQIDSIEDAWNIVPEEEVKFINQEEINSYNRTTEPNVDNSSEDASHKSISIVTKTSKRRRNHFTIIWLNEIITSYSIGHQAKIVFILYGPLHRDKLMWSAMCENTAADANQVSACFGELGWALRLLQSERWWSEFDSISAIEEMTSLPDEWLAENIACLLYTAGYTIATQYISYKSINGLASEVAIILTSMCLVQVKLGTNFKNVLALVDKACLSASSKRDRRLFLDKLAVSFQDVIIDLYETDEIDNRLEDFSTLLKAQASFVRAIFSRMYED